MAPVPGSTEPIPSASEHDVAVVAVAAAAAPDSGAEKDNGDGTASGEVNAECCVCWDPLGTEAIVFPCFHMACSNCVEKLVRTAAKRTDNLITCPMCRRQSFPAELRRLLRVGPVPEEDQGHEEATPEEESPMPGAGTHRAPDDE